MVWKLVNKAKTNKSFLSELMSNKDTEDALRMQIGMLIGGININDSIIDSVTSVNEQLLKDHDIKVKDWVVNDIMKKDLDMSFRKIKPVSAHANSDKNLILRQ